MHTSLKRLNLIKKNVNEIISSKQLNNKPKIIAVTKMFPMNIIKPLLDEGHLHFGENKIQEAESKWFNIRSKYNNLQLHMIGKLQSNKAKKAVKLFDYIHSLDSKKLAFKINQYEKELNKKTKLFIQVNIGKEEQKNGISLDDVKSFYNYCTNELSLNIIGLMCLPPIKKDTEKYFDLIEKKSIELNLKDLSIGMSSDYNSALLFGATFLRLGESIFGRREVK